MIKLKEKSWIPEIVIILIFIFNFSIFNYFDLFNKMSLFKLGICDNSCFGPFKAIDNPIPWVCFFGIYISAIFVIFSFFVDHPKYRFKNFLK